MKKLLLSLALLVSVMLSPLGFAGADIEINTPAISAIKNSMQARHGQLASFYSNGAIGLTNHGMIAVKDASAVPLKDRSNLNSFVAAENADRVNLYREIAIANGHSEWQAEIQNTFAARWIEKAQSGWYYQSGGGWVKK